MSTGPLPPQRYDPGRWPHRVAFGRDRDSWAAYGLMLGDVVAHALSPIGGVGINLAVHDDVATVNLLVQPLRDGILSTEHLVRVQVCCVLPTIVV